MENEQIAEMLKQKIQDVELSKKDENKNNKIVTMSILEAGTEIKEKETVGQEFIEWAEKYWHLDKLVKIEDPDKFAGETCDYSYMRNIFIEKINAIIKDRLG